MATKIAVLYNNTHWIENLVTSAQWSGDVSQPFRTLTLSVSNTKNSEDEAIAFELGKEIRFYVNKVGLFRGIIFTYDISSDGNATVIAHDENVYLTKNVDTRKFVKMTAGAIVKEVAKAYEIPTGDIASTGYVIPRMILKNMTLWDMIVTALTETRAQSGRKFYAYAREGKLNLREKKDEIVRWMLEDGVNIITASRSQSIEEMRTSVKAIGGDSEDKPLVSIAKNAALAKQYGLMQHVESADSRLKKSAIDQLAKERLKELGKVTEDVTVEALGITEVVAGYAVYAFESMTRLVGGFYVNADTHTFENGSHRMDVTLSKTDDLPKLEYEEPEQFEKAKTAKKKAKEKTAKAKKTPKPKKPAAETVVDRLLREINGGS
ncbi:hypothetical protein J2T13_000139 [Paenibacillus sp. DS2015]|uniref:XkdQ/YqbQ family protein n=1 Tax=Paenibacillus sp. DS2015 TaxID=3373917 RepID=UPI003D226576